MITEETATSTKTMCRTKAYTNPIALLIIEAKASSYLHLIRSTTMQYPPYTPLNTQKRATAMGSALLPPYVCLILSFLPKQLKIEKENLANHAADLPIAESS